MRVDCFMFFCFKYEGYWFDVEIFVFCKYFRVYDLILDLEVIVICGISDKFFEK